MSPAAQGSHHELFLRRKVKQENIATDLVDFYRELIQCLGAGMTQKVLIGRFDKWAVETLTPRGAEAGVNVVCRR